MNTSMNHANPNLSGIPSLIGKQTDKYLPVSALIYQRQRYHANRAAKIAVSGKNFLTGCHWLSPLILTTDPNTV
jgi:hypothetical protein